MVFELLALLSCGTFFGAALYISLAQHPAVLETGAVVGGRFFPPMYKRAAPMQIALALIGFITGILAWYSSTSIVWLIGSIFLISVVPITLFFIKPVNDVLLSPEINLESENIQAQLLKWGPLHWARTLVSGVAFLLYSFAAVT